MLFHLSPVANRDSILAHGLDWRYMGAARGLAGSTEPEPEGIYVCRSMEDVTAPAAEPTDTQATQTQIYFYEWVDGHRLTPEDKRRLGLELDTPPDDLPD